MTGRQKVGPTWAKIAKDAWSEKDKSEYLDAIVQSNARQRTYRTSKPSVYFIQEKDNGPIKIGYSDNPLARLSDLQVGNPRELTLLGHIYGGPEIELMLQTKFVEHKIRGEWFHPSEAIIDFIRNIKSRK